MLGFVPLVAQPDVSHLGSPAGRMAARVVPGGVTILPNGRFVTPIGTRTYTGDDLFNVVVSPDGTTTIGMSDGQIHVITADGHKILHVKGWSPAAAFTPDGKTLLVSEGDEGEIAEYDTATWTIRTTIKLNPGKEDDANINDLAVSPDGKYAFGVDVTNEEFDTVDLAKHALVSRMKAGREPYALAYDPQTKRAYVANIGLFDYTPVPPGPDGKPGITRPPFAFPSKEAEKGTNFEGRFIPGLGKTGTPDAQSVWAYDVADPYHPKLAKTAISGMLIHAPTDRGKAFGGSAPNALVVQDGKLYVSNANSDTVSIFRAADLKLLKSVKLAPTSEVAGLRGVIPTGLAITKDGSRLYVCESGLEAVAVIDPKEGKLLGQIPSAYYPLQARLTPDESSLLVACQFGLGYGPKGYLAKRSPIDDRPEAHQEVPGLIQRIPLPLTEDLAALTKRVVENNGLTGPITRTVQFPPQIKHVVFITKENHTYDGIFGAVPGGDGEPRYSEFGDKGWIHEKSRTNLLPVMPNHIALAKQFSISDNFYMEPGASGDGHRWLVGVYASIWTSRLYYAGWNFGLGRAKGRYISFDSNGSQIPEDYLENGSLWEHLDRGKISFRNYGEGFEFPGVDEGEPRARSGAVEPLNFPVPKVLYDNTCWEFPIFNMNIPDIARADWFEEDLKKNYRDKKKPLPQFMNIAICNDHGKGAAPKDGYPYVCSYMADNDLALGKIVDYLSHTPEWKSMAIFVTQDDPGGDNDHVDRSRSYVLAIGPYCKHGYVSHDHASIMSVIRSIYNIFGLGPNNLFDALANPLDDMFTDKPDFAPYKALPSNPAVFKPEATMDPNDPHFKKRRGKPTVAMDDPNFIKYMEARAQQH